MTVRAFLRAGSRNLVQGLRLAAIAVVMAKLLGPAEYGLWAQAMVLVVVGSQFALLSLDRALIKFLPAAEIKGEQSQALYTYLAVVFLASSVAAGGLWVATGPIVQALEQGSPNTAAAFRLAAILVLLTTVSTFLSNYFQSHLRMRLLLWVAIVQEGLEGFLSVAVVLAGGDVVDALGVVALVRGGVLALLLIKCVTELGRPAWSREWLDAGVSYAAPIALTAPMVALAKGGDRLIIGSYLGAGDVGIFELANNVSQLAYFPVGALVYVLVPRLHRLNATDPPGMERTLRRGVALVWMVVLPGAIGVSAMARPLLLLFGTPEFADRGARLLPLLGAAAVLYGTYTLLSEVLLLAGLSGRLPILWGVSLVTNVALNVALVPRYGLVAAAVAQAATQAATLLITVLMTRGVIPRLMHWPTLWRAVVASGALALFLLLVGTIDGVKIVVVPLVGALIYVSVLVLLGTFKGHRLDLGSL